MYYEITYFTISCNSCNRCEIIYFTIAFNFSIIEKITTDCEITYFTIAFNFSIIEKITSDCEISNLTTIARITTNCEICNFVIHLTFNNTNSLQQRRCNEFFELTLFYK